MKSAALAMSLLVTLATCAVWSLAMPLYFVVLLTADLGDTSARHFIVASLASVAAALTWSVLAHRIAASCLQGESARKIARLSAALGFATFVLLAAHFLWQCYLEWQAYLGTAP